MEINEEGNGKETETIEDKIEEPKVNMMFDSLQEVYDYYKRYAQQMGFTVTTKSSQKSYDDWQVKYVTFACNLFGKSRCNSNIILRPYSLTKTDCKAKLNTLLGTNGKWRISNIVTDHNHVLSPGKARNFRCNKVLKPHVKRQLELNDRAGIRMNMNNNSSVVEAGEHENLTFLEKDPKNYIEKGRRLRLKDGDAIAVQNYFKKMQTSNSNFFYTMDVDKDGQLKNVFWADARSRAAFEEFGDVIMFDTTYLINKYDMPFTSFVGINHHGQSILLGCGLISREDTNTFIWLFQSWLTCMSGHAPAAIITDQDKAIQNASEVVFPNARHRWCLWHIMKKLPEKLKGYKEYEGIEFALQNIVYDSLTPLEFEKSWNLMIEKFKLDSDDWLTGLYNERRRWVSAFVKGSFWAGMSTIGRSESMHAFFDGYVNSKTTLKQFVEQYEDVLRSKVEKENLEDFDSSNSCPPCLTHYDMEKQLQEAYTTTKFREFQHELTGKMYCVPSLVKEVGAMSEYEVSEDVKVGETLKHVNFKVLFNKVESEKECEVKCCCRLFEYRGILCRHAISVFIHKGIYYIPAKYIFRRWRKDIRRRHTKVKISYDDWSAKPEGRRFDRIYNVFHNIAYLAINSEDKCNMVMDWINDLEEELCRNKGVCGSSQPIPRSNTDGSSGGEAIGISKDNQNILAPLAIQSKGRPPFKRKLSTVDQIYKEKKEKKKKKSREKKTSEVKGKDSQITGSEKIDSSEDRPIKQVVDVIQAQGSISVTDSQITQNVHVYGSEGNNRSTLQFHNVPSPTEVPHLPIGIPGFHNGPPSFAPHQLYFCQGTQGNSNTWT